MKRRFVITLSIGSTIREEVVWFEDKPNVILDAVLTGVTHWMPLPDPPKGETNEMQDPKHAHG